MRATAAPRRPQLLTPSASPSVGPPDHPPPKRLRLRSTPSSTSNESSTSVDVNSARRASTLRVLNVWAQLAERYNKRLNEDDIVDLYSGVIIKDRGVLRGASRDHQFGQISQPDDDQDYPDADQDQEDSDQDDDDELNALPPSEVATDEDAPISKEELLRGVPPLSATTDAEDLREFLEAEKKRRELAGDEEDDMSEEQLSALRKVLEEREAASAGQPEDVASAEHPLAGEVDSDPTPPSTRAPPSDDESEDELALWMHDESTAVYPVPRDESEQDVREVEQDVIELPESDSDAEFEALLVHPPSYAQSSPRLVPRPKEIQQPLQSPPDSECETPKSRGHRYYKTRSAEELRKPRSRPRSPLVPLKPEVVLTHKNKRKSSAPGEMNDTTSSAAGPGQETADLICEGKGKESAPLTGCSDLEKSSRVVSRGRKRKRIASSSANSDLSAQVQAEPKSNSRGRRKSISQNSFILAQPDGSTPTVDKDSSSPTRCERAAAGSSHSFSPASKNRQHSVPVYEPLESEQMAPDSDASNALFSEPIMPYRLRHPSRPPSIFSSPPSLSMPVQPMPPIDPVQAQQAHYLLAQAMHHLSYLLSATVPPYAAYASNSNSPWHHTLPHPHAPPPPHAVYNTPTHLAHLHGARLYHTPSSSVPRSVLPPSSPVQTSVSPPTEERRVRGRGRSKSRGRRVSFNLDDELQHSASRKQTLEMKREKGKGNETEESCDTLRSGPPDSSREVARGRTPGPPDRKRNGKSLPRR